MPAPAWLQVSGISLSTENSSVHADPSTIVAESQATIDENENHRTAQRFDHVDLVKKLFLDRQIKKAKSLPGLIKGTALSRHTPLQSPPNGKGNGDDSKPVSVDESIDDHLSTSTQQAERSQEGRRPRVVFADVNRVQFFDDDQDDFDPHRARRSRYRSAKRSTPLIVPNPTFAPSIQHTQSLYVPPSSSVSRQGGIQPDLNIRRQPLIVASPRLHSSRVTHLPDIVNPSSNTDAPIRERYMLQREKSFVRLPEPAADQSLNSSAEVSRESTRAGGTRQNGMPYVSDLNLRLDTDENSIHQYLNNSFISSIPTSRQRATFQPISLRQQFALPSKPKSTHLRRSASMRHASQQSSIVEDETPQPITHFEQLAPVENRPMTGSTSSRKLNRSYISHFNTTKVPFNGTTISNGTHDSSSKSHLYESSQDSFEQPLKVLSTSYLNNLHPAPLKKSNVEGSLRSSRTTSTRRSHEFQVTSNTVTV